MEPTIEDALDMEPTVEEENINRTIDQYVRVPPSNYQEQNEGQQATIKTLEHPIDVLQGTVTTPLPPLASTRRRKHQQQVLRLQKQSV